MTLTDGLGFLAALLVLATFSTNRLVPLRCLAILSNLAFVSYGLALELWPVVTLHVVLIPINLAQLWRVLRSRPDLRSEQPRARKEKARAREDRPGQLVSGAG